MSQLNKITIFFIAILFVAMFLDARSRALNDYVSSFNSQSNKSSYSFTGCYDTGEKGIEEISLYYSSDDPMQIDQARASFLSFVNQFLEGLNKNSKLEAQLNPYPFSPKNLDVVIFYRNSKGKYATSPYIGQISMKGGVISYYKYSQGQFEVVKQESFSTAKRASS